MQKFDRVAYRKKYDQTYFKKTVRCPRCGETKVKHMLARHMRTRKCRDHQDLAELDLDFGEPGADAFVGPHRLMFAPQCMQFARTAWYRLKYCCRGLIVSLLSPETTCETFSVFIFVRPKCETFSNLFFRYL